MRKLIAILAVALAIPTMSFADPIKPLLIQLKSMHKVEFEGYSGYLFKRSIQFDEDNPTYSVYINDVQYNTILDDGRGTSKKADKCPTENFWDENPSTGCAITFDGEYIVDSSSSSSTLTVETKIWNLEFIE